MLTVVSVPRWIEPTASTAWRATDWIALVTAASIPNCISYDPAYAYELAVIIDDGMRRMMERGEDVFYYVTVTNENEAQPSMPAGVQDGILRGLYCLDAKPQAQARLL